MTLIKQTSPPKHLIRVVLNLFQLLCVAVLSFFAWKLLKQNSEFEIILATGKFSLSWLGLGLLALGAGFMMAYFRLYMILKIMDLPANWPETLRACTYSDIVGAFTFGTTGTDLSRCLMIMKSLPQNKAKILVCIMLDRLMGLSSLLLLGLIGIIVSPSLHQTLIAPHSLQPGYLLWMLILAAVLSQVMFLLAPICTRLTLLNNLILKIPILGTKLHKVMQVLSDCSQYRRFFLVIIAYSIGIHLVLATGIFLIGSGLQLSTPPWTAHLITYPLVTLTGILPLPFAGFGLGEVSADFLYTIVGQRHSITVQPGTGVIIMLTLRIFCLSILMMFSLFSIFSKPKMMHADLRVN